MKAKDIEVGGHYAVGHKDYPYEAVVVEKGLHRHVHSAARWDFRGHKSDKPDGIKVRFVDSEREAIEPASRFHRTWDEQVVRNRERDAAEQRREDRSDRIKRLAKQLTELGIKARSIGVASGYRGGFRAALEIEDPDDAEKLVRLLSVGRRLMLEDGDVQVDA